MALQIAVSCLLAVASAGFVGHTAYSYPYVAVHAEHIPVIGPNGVPLDEPAVAHAKVAHAAAHVEAQVRNGDVHVAHVATHHVEAPIAYAAHYGYAGPIHLPVIGHNGVPVDEPAVQARRAEHAAAHVEAHVRNGDAAIVHHPVVHHPVVHHSVVATHPADTPEVSAAKAAHFAAHVEAKARNGIYHYAPLVHYRKRRGIFAYSAPVAHIYAGAQHLPVIGPNGVPIDEPAVAHARAAHAAAHVEAQVRNGDTAVVAPVVATHVAAHVAAQVHTVYSGPQHLPVIGPNGVPIDEPAVAHARAAHAAAHIEAEVRNGDAAIVAHAPIVHSHVVPVHHYGGAVHVPVIGHDGVPADEPAVVAARAHHAAAHIEAKVRNGDIHHFATPVVYAY